MTFHFGKLALLGRNLSLWPPVQCDIQNQGTRSKCELTMRKHVLQSLRIHTSSRLALVPIWTEKGCLNWWTIAWGKPFQHNNHYSCPTWPKGMPLLLTVSLLTSGCIISTQEGTTALYTNCNLELSGFICTYLKRKGTKQEWRPAASDYKHLCCEQWHTGFQRRWIFITISLQPQSSSKLLALTNH